MGPAFLPATVVWPQNPSAHLSSFILSPLLCLICEHRDLASFSCILIRVREHRNWGRLKTRKGAEVSHLSPVRILSWQRQALVQLLDDTSSDSVAQLLLCVSCVTAAPFLFSKLLCQFTMHVVTYSALIWLPFCFSETMIVYGRAVMCCQHRLLATCWQWPNIAWDTVSLWNGLTMLRL